MAWTGPAHSPDDIDFGFLWPSEDGWSLTSNVVTPGHVRLVLFNAKGTLAGQGDIAQLDFTVDSNAPGGSTLLDIQPVDPNEGGRLWTESDGSILIDSTPPIAGDYDASGTVDIDDYALWKATFGSTTELADDGNGNGVIDAGDYTVYRDNLGNTAG